MSRTVLVMAGGTGGHIFPGLAVADCLRSRGWRVVWLGSRGGMEEQLVPQRGYLLERVRFSGVRRKGAAAWLLLPFFLVAACAKSVAVLLRQRPDVVLGMGGFAAFPGGLMASLLRRPLVLHEQNAVAGLANRVLAGVADRVLAGFPGAFEPAHWVGRSAAQRWFASLLRPAAQPLWIGNPVRSEIAALPPPQERYAGRGGPLRLLVLGGSRGARALNKIVPAALARMPAHARPVVLHQSGAADAPRVGEAYRESGCEARVEPFLDDMAQVYRDCDLVVCRAGALTLAELAAAGVPGVLVPYPHAVDDHQSANARFLSERGAAVLIPQQDLSAERLAALLAEFDRDRLLAMAAAARTLAKPEAASAAADICQEAAA